jgi:hypothetical protein
MANREVWAIERRALGASSWDRYGVPNAAFGSRHQVDKYVSHLNGGYSGTMHEYRAMRYIPENREEKIDVGTDLGAN